MIKRLVPLIAIGAFLLAWQLVAMNANPLLLPSFTMVVRAFVHLLLHGGLLGAIGTSAIDAGAGFAIGLVTGFLGGVLMGSVEFLDRALSPFVNFINATPVVALVPMIIIWLGEGAPARIFFVWIICVWAVLVNTLHGVRDTDGRYLEVARAFGFSHVRVMWQVRVPAAMPYVFSGVRVALGLALIGMLVGEMDMELAGIGGLATDYGNSFKTAEVLAVVFVASAFGVFVVWGLKIIQLWRFRWISDTAGDR